MFYDSKIKLLIIKNNYYNTILKSLEHQPNIIIQETDVSEDISLFLQENPQTDIIIADYESIRPGAAGAP